MFSKDLDIFVVYELLWIIRKWSKIELDRNLLKDVIEVVGVLMICNFVENLIGIKFLFYIYKNWVFGLFVNLFKF